MLLAIWIIYVLFCVKYQSNKILINWKLLKGNKINKITAQKFSVVKVKKKNKIKEKSKK